MTLIRCVLAAVAMSSVTVASSSVGPIFREGKAGLGGGQDVSYWENLEAEGGGFVQPDSSAPSSRVVVAPGHDALTSSSGLDLTCRFSASANGHWDWTYEARIFDPNNNQIAYGNRWAYQRPSFTSDLGVHVTNPIEGTYKCTIQWWIGGFQLPLRESIYVLTCPKPTNFRQARGENHGNGTLFFEYVWDSNTGNLNNLSQCGIRERVHYSPYPWPSPPFNLTGLPPNPYIRPDPPIPGSDGGLFDINSTATPFLTPYSAASVNGAQKFQHNCGCFGDSGTWIDLYEPWPGIDRYFHQYYDGRWLFTIWKSGVSSTVGPF